jgi:AcrR family transcriptional regulator
MGLRESRWGGRNLTRKSKSIRRLEILEAARKAFSEKGYSETRVEDIASLAGISKPTIYLYFRNKEELFFSLISEGLGYLSSLMRRCSEDPGSPIEKIERLIRTKLSFYQENKEFFRIIALERARIGAGAETRVGEEILRRDLEHVEMIASCLEEGIKAGHIRADVNPRDAALSLMGIVNVFVLQWIIECQKEDLSSKSHIISDLFLKGCMAIP